ncbi:MAG: serine/threonine protein kinase [Polyangiaceae bacterium]|nr:serine/threonine protein kinase [Polyangiaceae bacterium]
MISGPDTHADPASMPLGSVVAGRYQVTRLLGEGGFGAVFEANDRATGGRVALKIVSAAVLEASGGQERFRREVDIVRRLSHPNIVRVVDSGLDPGGTLYIAFELLEGQSLEAELERRGAMQPHRVASLARQVLGALDAAHAAGVIHRDIKPANVFLTGTTADVAKLLDFGIAKSTNPNSMQGLTKHGMMLGTPAYMSPEQLFGKPVGPSSDLFAFGIVMAEMLNGRTLYRDDVSPMSIIQERIQAGRVPIPESVQRSPLGDVIARAVVNDVAQRYQSAREMIAAIDVLAPRLGQQTFTTGGTLESASAGATHFPVGALGQAGTTDVRTPHHLAGDITGGGQPGYTAPGYYGQSGPSPSGAVGQPQWGAEPGPMPPPPVVKARPARSSSLWIVLVVGVLAVFALGAGTHFVLNARHEAKPPKKRDKTSERDRREPASAAPPKPTPTPTPVPRPSTTPTLTPPPPPPLPGSSISTEVVAVRSCKGAAALTQPSLRKRLTDSGMPVRGDLLYCPGDMINFRCSAPEGRGFTVDAGGTEGSAALFKLANAAEAEAFARKEAASGKPPLTIVFDGPKVLRLEMPSASASKVLAGVCK